MEPRPGQQTRTESKTRLVEQINIYLHSSDCARALDLLRGTAAEFPDDPELSDLEKLAQLGVERKAEADRLITESQELFAQQKSGQAIEALREAYQMDKNNSLARTILANALVEHAHAMVETDWREAESLAREALELNPAHPTAKNIRSLVFEQKKTNFVEECILQARKLQTSPDLSAADLSAALSRIAEGLAVYPSDPRLLQVQDSIHRDQATQRRQARRRDLEDLRAMESELYALADAASKKAFVDRIQEMTAKYPTDGEILFLANSFLRLAGLLEVPQKSSTAAAESEDTSLSSNIPPRKAPDIAAGSMPNSIPGSNIFPKKASPDERSSSEILPSEIVTSKPSGGKSLTSKTSQREPSRSPSRSNKASEIEISSTQPPSEFSTPQPVTVSAEPSAPADRVKSRSSEPKKSARSTSTTLIFTLLAAAIIAVAAVVLVARKNHASQVASSPAAAPIVPESSATAPDISAPAVPSPATAAPSASGIPISVPGDSAPPAAIPAPSPRSAFMESGRNIASAPDIKSARDSGTLLIVAGQDDAKIFLNGEVQRQLTRSGQLRLSNLELRDYTLQVSKQGFRDPPAQTIRLHKGEQARVVFDLQPLPRLAALTIQGGVPGTTVLVDQTTVGIIQPDGTLSASSVDPGDHIIELRRERFKTRQLKKHFIAGTAVSLGASDAALDASPAELKITFAPTDARVAIAKSGEPPKTVSSGVPLNLAAGTYTLTARTADAFTRSSTLEVISGQSRSLDLSLAPNGMSKWEDSGAWKQEKDSFIRKGGDFVLYGVVPASGTFVFSAMPAKSRLLQWVANFVDSKNYVLFQMDENNFYRTLIRNGEKTNQIIVPDKADKRSLRTLHVRVSPTEITHQIRHGDSWTLLDRWTQPGTNLALGKFGFYLPANEEVLLSGFAHYPDLNIR